MATAALAGSLALAPVLRLQDSGYKAWVIMMAVAVLPTVIAITGRPKELLLCGWVFSLTYNRQYYIFESLVGYNGTQGPYLILADICLAGLFGYWMYERIMGHPREPVRGGVLWPWYLPFAAVCFLSIPGAQRPDWAAYEFIRVIKIGLVFYYVRRNFGRKEWVLALATMAAAVSFQSAVGIKEVATGRPGVLGFSKAASADAPDFLEHFEGGDWMGMVRGVGTLAHPPYMACYLMLALPVLLAVALAAKRRQAAPAAIAVLLGLGGLAATMSRWPWAVAALQLGLVLLLLVLMRQVAAQRALGLVIVGSFVLMMGLLPVKEKLMNRINGDFTESVRYREEGIRASWEAIGDHPLLGFGLNNTSLYLGKYLPDMEWGLVTEEFATHTLHLRAPISLGNGFLYIAEQTGLLGLSTFILLVIGGLLAGARAVVKTTGVPRAACLGMTVGMLGALAEQLIDTPLWVDPVLYMFVLFIAMLNIAPALFGPQTEGRTA